MEEMPPYSGEQMGQQFGQQYGQQFGQQFGSPPPVQLHSRLGIASFALSIISGIAIFVLVVCAAVMVSKGVSDDSPTAIVLGLLMLGFMGLAFVSLCLGIAGLIQSQRKKVLAILGTVFSAVILIGIISLMVIGLAVGE